MVKHSAITDGSVLLAVILMIGLGWLLVNEGPEFTGSAVGGKCTTCTEINSLTISYLGNSKEMVAYVYNYKAKELIGEYALVNGSFVIDSIPENISKYIEIRVGKDKKKFDVSCKSKLKLGKVSGAFEIVELDSSVEEVCKVKDKKPKDKDDNLTCNDCDGKVTNLTLKYNGNQSAVVKVVQKKDDTIVFDDVVNVGGEFSFVGVDKYGTLGTEILVFVDGVESVRVHTSCSKPVGPGLVFGDFEVVSGASRNGGVLCQEDEEVCKKDKDCDKGEICVDKVCVIDEGCKKDKDCDKDDVCVGGVCVVDESCKKDKDCDEGEVCVDKVCVEGENIAPTASITGPGDGDDFKVGNNVLFSGVGTDLDGNITFYIWSSSIDGDIGSSNLFSLSNLSIGTHLITLTVVDDGGLNDSDTISITIKSLEDPTASIFSPVQGSDYKQGHSVFFSGSGSDPDGSIIVYKWVSSIDGLIGTTTSFSLSNLSIGLHTITFMVVDDDGLNDTDTVTVEVKSLKAPTASITNPGDGDNFRQYDSILFSGTGSDPDGKIVDWSWNSSIDGLFFSQSGGEASTFTYDALSLGTHLITLIVVDDDGLKFVDTFTITIDVNPLFAPTASIVSPLEGVVFRQGDNVLFSGLADDVNGSITSYQWSSSRDGVLSSLITFGHSGLSTGMHTITFTVIDNDNQTGDDSIVIVVLDNDFPTASIVSPFDGSNFKEGHSILFAGVGDNEVISSYLWTSNLDGFLSSEAQFSSSGLTLGEHLITFTVVDDDNQSASDSIVINVNVLTAPVASIISPVSNSDYKKGQAIFFSGVGSDDDGVVEEYYWTSDVEGAIGSESSFGLSNLPVGYHTITFTVVDNDGLTASDAIQITVKPLYAPTASIVQPNNGDHFKEQTPIGFVGSGSDPDGEIVEWIWSSDINGIFGGLQSFSYSALSLGKHDITLTVVDDDWVRYTDTFTIWIMVDPLLSPDVTIMSPLDGATYRENDVLLFNASVTDDGFIVNHSWSSDLDSVLASGSGVPASFEIDNLSVGYHEVSLVVVDDDSLSSSDTVYFWIVPLLAPNVTILTPVDNSSFTEGDVIDFSALISDDGIINSIVWNSDLDGNIGIYSSFNISSLTVGEHRITLFVVDDDGLTTVEQITLSVKEKPSTSSKSAGSGGGSGGGAGGESGGGSGGEAPEIDLEEGDIRVTIVDVPSVVDLDKDSFVVIAEVENVGGVSLKGVMVLTEIIGWSAETVDVGVLDPGEQTTVSLVLVSELCSSDELVVSEKIKLVVRAGDGDVADSDKAVIRLNAPEFALLYDVQGNNVSACFAINNKGKEGTDKAEIEFGIYEGKSALLLDYLTNIEVPSDEIFIKAKSYELSYVPETKDYEFRASLYDKGVMFSDDYLRGEVTTWVELHKYGESFWDRIWPFS